MTAPRHVWVALTGVWGDQAMPGVLLDWRQDHEARWEAWVIWAEPGIGAHNSGPYVHQSWVPGTAVRPVDADPPTS